MYLAYVVHKCMDCMSSYVQRLDHTYLAFDDGAELWIRPPFKVRVDFEFHQRILKIWSDTDMRVEVNK